MYDLKLRRLTADLKSAELRVQEERALRIGAEAEIRLATSQLQYVADNAPFLIAFLDPNFIFRFVNRAHVQWFQRPHDEIVGKPMAAVVGNSMAADYLEAMSSALATDLPQTVLHERSWVGRCKFVELTFVAQLDESGQLRGYWLTARDAPEADLHEQTLLVATRRDPLTGLCNQASFTERLMHALGTVDFAACLLTVAYVDLDRFKQVNERFGHKVGDQLLKELGRRMIAVLRPADTVASLDGGAIALIMRFKAPDDVRVVGTRLLERIREPFLVEEHRIQATASIGFAIAISGDTTSTLLKRADEALREVKSGGRDGMTQAEAPNLPVPTADDLTCR